uniref:Uncharacterized protein n=1 Tax=Oryza meridionalis TaxID=40149 RepID=A0A0E0D0R3_9ORYZ
MSSSLLPFLLGGGGGNWKAAVLQNLLSFVVEQEKSVVVLLSNLVRFAMDKVTGTSTVARRRRGRTKMRVESSSSQ